MGLLTKLFGIASDFGEGGKSITPSGFAPTLRDELRSLKASIHAPVADATALAAIAANDRAGGMRVVNLATGLSYVFDADSSAVASGAVIVPTVGDGRWLADVPVTSTLTGTIEFAPGDFTLVTGAPLAIFADGASAVPGLAIVDSKGAAIRWNNNATLNGIMASFLVPADMDITADAVVHVRASKIGASAGDLPTFVVGAFNQVDGALHDADADFGGTSSAMANSATKTLQNVTRTLALANLAAYPASVTLTIKPTDGTLTNDDLALFQVYITYTKKLVA